MPFADAAAGAETITLAAKSALHATTLRLDNDLEGNMASPCAI
jgi:hypothetical protein